MPRSSNPLAPLFEGPDVAGLGRAHRDVLLVMMQRAGAASQVAERVDALHAKLDALAVAVSAVRSEVGPVQPARKDEPSTTPTAPTAADGRVAAELARLRAEFKVAEQLQDELERARADLNRRDVVMPAVLSLIHAADHLEVAAKALGVKSTSSPFKTAHAELVLAWKRHLRTLEHYQVSRAVPRPGETFNPALHEISAECPTADAARVGTVAKFHTQAFVDSSGRAVRRALVDVFTAESVKQ